MAQDEQTIREQGRARQQTYRARRSAGAKGVDNTEQVKVYIPKRTKAKFDAMAQKHRLTQWELITLLVELADHTETQNPTSRLAEYAWLFRLTPERIARMEEDRELPTGKAAKLKELPGNFQARLDRASYVREEKPGKSPFTAEFGVSVSGRYWKQTEEDDR